MVYETTWSVIRCTQAQQWCEAGIRRCVYIRGALIEICVCCPESGGMKRKHTAVCKGRGLVCGAHCWEDVGVRAAFSLQQCDEDRHRENTLMTRVQLEESSVSRLLCLLLL